MTMKKMNVLEKEKFLTVHKNCPETEKSLTVHSIYYSRTEKSGREALKQTREAVSAVGLARGQSVHAIHSKKMLAIVSYKWTGK